MSQHATATATLAHRQAASVLPSSSKLLQRKCACGGSSGLQDECQDCRNNNLKLQRRSASGGEPHGVPPIVHDVLRSPGRPLDRPVASFFEARIGNALSRVTAPSQSK